MKKATSVVVDEPTARRLKFVSLVAGNAGVLPQEVVDRFVTNEGREEIPARLLRGFSNEVTEVPLSATILTTTKMPAPRLRIEILRETPKPCAKRTADEQIVGMQAMYKMLGWELTVSGLSVPERREGFDRLLVVGDTLTNNRGYDACEASFPSWRYSNDLDSAVPTNDRDPKNGAYAVWFRDRIEADKELRDLSADMLKGRDIKGITLLERLLFEPVYFMETGKHLDIQNRTLCSGSRFSDGNVPGADWGGDRFKVDWFCRDSQRPGLRSREAVSL